jgi:transcription-repair coupling factor (superfamily II helicase)
MPKPDLEIRWDEGDGHIPMPWRRYNWSLNTLDERGLQELQAWLDEAKTIIYYSDSEQARPLPLHGDVRSQTGKIPYSFIDNERNVLYLAERSFSYMPPPDSQLAATDASSVDFCAGDLVVHDQHGIGRFVEMLRGMLDRTQFIVITHNRKTMEIANRLYGVTMEEPGVSKVISLQMN